MAGLSRRFCWGCAGLVVICILAALIRTGAPIKASTIGSAKIYTPAAAVDAVEPVDPAIEAAVAAAVDAVDGLGPTDTQVRSFALVIWFMNYLFGAVCCTPGCIT